MVAEKNEIDNRRSAWDHGLPSQETVLSSYFFVGMGVEPSACSGAKG
jgi:hypothetical protein